MCERSVRLKRQRTATSVCLCIRHRNVDCLSKPLLHPVADDFGRGPARAEGVLQNMLAVCLRKGFARVDQSRCTLPLGNITQAECLPYMAGVWTFKPSTLLFLSGNWSFGPPFRVTTCSEWEGGEGNFRKSSADFSQRDFPSVNTLEGRFTPSTKRVRAVGLVSVTKQ